MCFEIFSEGEEPWDGITNTEAKRNVVHGKHLQMPESCPEKFRAFIHEKIFVVDPKKRVMMDDVVRFIEPVVTDMSNSITTTTSTLSSAPERSERPRDVSVMPMAPSCAPTTNNSSKNAKVEKSKGTRKKMERTKKEQKKKKKTAHPGNHNMIEK